ncbi:ATP-dependent DNA helicase RecG [Clostridium sp. MT-14]|uniref:ATP-dependent DNA helicase RecG n=1 Tax=Clostridium aromativorans TaxID=2836848 RepID=A0ABS8N4S3_9CLOT|nr:MULTISPECIES: ATP-dependent DNA helicase RecG [Clostridium]KAA8677055.1 ATP-dependent DNA helicase RecG [Clostridium sp. HV4-5-A1G]MCC9294661.1 ATP-dependent DNA helicase RecG [Clostridium aromativorans]CAB1243645.1 ATP-dependent DNA helicase RecG [Clostridiaceae bacterium BL-3]
MNAYDDVKCIKGVGDVTAGVLNKCFIFNILDLLLYFPRDYEVISSCSDLKDENVGKVIIDCRVKNICRDIRTKSGKIISTIVFQNKNTVFKGRWFNQPYIKNKFRVNNEYRIMGKVQKFKGQSYMTNPVMVNDHKLDKTEEKIIPIYPLKSGITNNTFMKLISEVLRGVKIEENLPGWIIDKYKFYSLDRAIRIIHNPANLKELNQSKRRLKFQELFIYSLKILMLKYSFINERGIAFKISPELIKLKKMIPYELTGAQKKVMREILIDEKRQVPMNRLLQGDVGSGKTIVGLIAIFNVVKNGYQAVLMAPTEILATQHYIEAKKLLEKFSVNVKLLCGSTTAKNKEGIKQELKLGKIDILIGTHALIQEDVQFKNLGMVVTDEQHRFGVMQRSKLTNKGENVDVLIMTATPIPRTLSLYLYGDLDVSTIDELPPGRKKIATYYRDKNSRDNVYRFALDEIKKGKQVYVVCPLVEENEQLNLSSVEDVYRELKEKYFKNVQIEMLHGKMSSKDKEDIMDRFKRGEIKVMVSTTVIEVGINVPNATVMIVENAERFGLAQLHQLRGRVGRGEDKAYCILIADIKNDIIRKRMEIMKCSNDGFYISEQDLKLRGAGEIFGFRQHGEDELILSNLVEDLEIFKKANLEAKRLLKSTDPEDVRIKEEIQKKLKRTSKFISFN